MQAKISKSFDSGLWEQKKYEIIAKASAIPGFIWAQRNFFATDLQISQNIQNTSSNLLTNISNVYCKSVVWLLFLIELCVYAFSKDDKKIALAKKCFIGCLVVYIFFKLIGTDGGVVGSTADKIAEWMGAK